MKTSKRAEIKTGTFQEKKQTVYNFLKLHLKGAIKIKIKNTLLN